MMAKSDAIPGQAAVTAPDETAAAETWTPAPAAQQAPREEPAAPAPNQVGPAYVIERTVDLHEPGDIVYLTEQDIAAGRDPARLLRLGVIREAAPSEANRAKPFGDVEQDRQVGLIPQVSRVVHDMPPPMSNAPSS